MSEAKEKVQNFIENITQFVTFHEPQSYKNLTIIPIILKDEILDFITIKEAEAAELGYIQEMKNEKVATLQAVNKGTKPMLIPYMQVVQGGKQDRTIYEPILVAAGKTEVTINIPSKCIERSRWTYRTNQVRSSKRFHTSPQKMSIGVQAKAMRAPYRHKSTQSEVWDSIETMSNYMSIGLIAAPTRSGIQIQNTQKSKIEDYASHYKLVKNQAGVIVLVNNQVVAFELYGNPAAFKIFWEDLLNSFTVEALLRLNDAKKNLKSLDAPEIHELALSCFENRNMQYKEQKGVGLGTVVEFADQNLVWVGITLIHDNKFAHLYIVGKSIFPKEKTRFQQLRVSQLRRQINRNEPKQVA